MQIQKDIAQESLNTELGIQDTEEPTEGKNQENEEVVAGGGQEQSPIQYNLENPPSTSSNILTGGYVPLA